MNDDVSTKIIVKINLLYSNGFAQRVSRQRLGKHGQRVSQWTNVIARC
jgi:hypothetical protein